MSTLPICPKCTCTSCVSNKHQNVPAFSQVAGNVLAAKRAGRVSDGLSDLVAWLGLQAANQLRSEWRCENCGNTF